MTTSDTKAFTGQARPPILDAFTDPAAARAAVTRAADALRAGKLVVIPTDTVYGVAAHPDRAEAVARLFAIKGREGSKPIALLVSDADAAHRQGAEFSPEAERLCARYWPGALTVVLRVAGAANGTEGFRVPDCALTRALLYAAGGALRVTSANRSGLPAATTAAEAVDALGADVDLVLDGGPSPRGVASSVVAIEAGVVRVLRAGALPVEAIMQVATGGAARTGPGGGDTE